MKCPPWEERADPEGLRQAVVRILADVVSQPSRLSVALLEQWHRILFEGRVEPDEYVGSIRQED